MASKKKQNHKGTEGLERLYKLRAKRFSRNFLLVVLVIIIAVFFSMVQIFLLPVMLAAVFTALFYPLYKRLQKLFKKNRGLSSFFCCLILLIGLLVPIYFIADLVSREAIEFYQTAEHKIREIIEKGDEGILGTIKNLTIVQRFNLNDFDWQSSLQEIVTNSASLLATFINKTSKGTFQLFTNLFITLFTMYYFFRDGDALIERLKYLSPLEDVYEEALILRFISVSRATIKGTLLIALTQGVLGGITLWAFGFSSPILWGVVMILLSIIPMVGAWLILYPAAIVLIITGSLLQGIAMILIASLVISNIDNLLRPRLVGRDTGMHDLMTFFSTLGGIGLFGVTGFIIGPVIAVLLLTILDIYSEEFKIHLDISQGIPYKQGASQKTKHL